MHRGWAGVTQAGYVALFMIEILMNQDPHHHALCHHLVTILQYCLEHANTISHLNGVPSSLTAQVSVIALYDVHSLSV